MVAAKLQWYYNRLRTMTPAEILFRAHRTLEVRVEKLLRLQERPVPAADLSRPGAPLTLPVDADDFDVAAYCRQADRVLAGEVQLLWKTADVGMPPNWHRNPVSGHDVPQSYGKTLDYRNTDRVGDIKYYWVFNRHHQTLALAAAYALTGEIRYLDGVRQLVSSWLAQNPPPNGANWTSSLEHGIRLINWAAIWSMIGGLESPLFADEEGQRLRDGWLDSVYQHASFIRRHFSRHSSANNHLIGEAAGLFVASLAWPHWPDIAKWGQLARNELEAEVPKQIGADGVSLEQTVFYEHFVLEFLLSAGLLADRARQPMSATFWQRVRGNIEHLASLTDAGGHVPSVGDGDDAVVLPLYAARENCIFQGMISVGAAYFASAPLAASTHSLSDRAKWLVNDARQQFNPPPRRCSQPIRRAFEDGGYRLLGADWGTSREVRLLLDVGPLGYSKIAAHGHADALSFVLHVGGQPFLVDPGTYAYQSHKEWREYFRSTAGHNTVMIDDVSQAVSGGNFMWLTHFATHDVTADLDGELQRAGGWHDGYLRLADPVRHHREVCLDVGERKVTVVDTLTAKTGHRYEHNWHVAPDIHVEKTGASVRLTGRNAVVTLHTNGDEMDVVSGAETPIRGWVSPRFDIKEPSHTVTWRSEREGDAGFETTLIIEHR